MCKFVVNKQVNVMRTFTTILGTFLFSIFMQAQSLERIHENGHKTTYDLQNGLIAFTTVNAMGTTIETGAFLDGRPHGEWLQFNELGEMIGQASYAFGDKEGKWLIWNTEKTVLYEINYLNNERVSAVRWKMDDMQLVNKD